MDYFYLIGSFIGLIGILCLCIFIHLVQNNNISGGKLGDKIRLSYWNAWNDVVKEVELEIYTLNDMIKKYYTSTEIEPNILNTLDNEDLLFIKQEELKYLKDNEPYLTYQKKDKNV